MVVGTGNNFVSNALGGTGARAKWLPCRPRAVRSGGGAFGRTISERQRRRSCFPQRAQHHEQQQQTTTPGPGESEVVSSSSWKPDNDSKSPYSKANFNLKAQPDGLISLKRSLELDGHDLAIINFAPGQGYTFTQSHECQEEVYICVKGRGQIQLNHETLNMEPGDIVRVSPHTRRSLYAHPQPRIGYSMKSNPEHFILYVLGAIPAANMLRSRNSQFLIDDAIPHFDDIPPWYRDNPTIIDRNNILKERYERMSTYRPTTVSSNGNRSESESESGVVSELHQSRLLSKLDKREGGGGDGSGMMQVVVCGVLISPDRKKVLLSQRQVDRHLAGCWEMPGGRAKENELPEEALSRQLKERIGIEAHPESFESFSFGTCKQNEENLLILVYTCSDWCGEPQGLEGQQLSWVGFSQLKNAEVSSVLGQSIPKLKAHLRSLKAREKQHSRTNST